MIKYEILFSILETCEATSNKFCKDRVYWQGNPVNDIFVLLRCFEQRGPGKLYAIVRNLKDNDKITFQDSIWTEPDFIPPLNPTNTVVSGVAAWTCWIAVTMITLWMKVLIWCQKFIFTDICLLNNLRECVSLVFSTLGSSYICEERFLVQEKSKVNTQIHWQAIAHTLCW